jgi:hypothetical protein
MDYSSVVKVFFANIVESMVEQVSSTSLAIHETYDLSPQFRFGSVRRQSECLEKFEK